MVRSPTDLANIGPTERNVRRWAGISMLAVGTVLTWWLVTLDAVAWWWALVFFALYYQAVRFVLDAQTGTCPLKAELGQRNLRGLMTVLGEPIADPALASTIRAISRRATVFSLVAAALLTAVSMWTASG